MCRVVRTGAMLARIHGLRLGIAAGFVFFGALAWLLAAGRSLTLGGTRSPAFRFLLVALFFFLGGGLGIVGWRVILRQCRRVQSLGRRREWLVDHVAAVLGGGWPILAWRVFR